ncbi:L,D-transpeptidase family protein [Qipengyuania sp. S6317L1]|uniref:L,D-transpeptidase family protein n=1 Tax=Qipengyuania sp. S6317L1 TaxID=2926410 RepID=UPI001FF35610|nr:L,D-transpeptidase family protein [Qipengyuania sp. S6317L1]MCK0099864.1 L,D-transpeptidase family protein [Qipengyuania sp. S6317L1]
MAIGKIRTVGVIGFAALLSGASLVVGQTSEEMAGDAAMMIAGDAEDAIRAIDPTTGGDSLVFDPSLPEPYTAPETELPALPALPGDTIGSPDRGAASRQIARPTANEVADLPELPSAPAEITARAMDLATPASSTPAIAAPEPVVAPPAPALAVAQAPEDPFVVNSILPIEGTIRYGEWFWDESRAPKKGKLVITVDLDARVISVFRDGHEIGTAVALLGTKSHPTPVGMFPILTKEKDNVSEKYDNAPMPWTLRMTWDGIAIHGSPVMNGYASHGCVGVPDPFAEKLFAIAKRGDKVIVTRGKMVGVGDKLINS